MNPLVDNKPMNPITQEYLDKIKKDLNCVGILIITTDSFMPCPDSLAGEECAHRGHKVNSVIHGMSAGAVMQLAHEAVQNSFKRNI